MLQPGTYFIGDLCYVMTREDWDTVNSITQLGDLQGELTMPNGVRVAIYNTAYGDGSFPVDASGKRIGNCPVDSGSIGAIKIEDVNPGVRDSLANKGVVREFLYPFATSNTHGIIRFDEVVVDTASEEIEEEEIDD